MLILNYLIQKALRQSTEVVQARIRRSGLSLTSPLPPSPIPSAADADAPSDPSCRKVNSTRRPSIILVSAAYDRAPYLWSSSIDGYSIKSSGGIFASSFVSYNLSTAVTEIDIQRGSGPIESVSSSVSVCRRYSDFVNFEEKLRGLLPRCILPVLPPKEVSRQTSDDVVVRRRLRYLQMWIRFVSKHAKMSRFLCFGEFISDSIQSECPPPPGSSSADITAKARRGEISSSESDTNLWRKR